jgi:hypothetical protein
VKELTTSAASYLFTGLLGVTLFVFSLVSMRKVNQFGHPLKGIFWFTLAVLCLCAMVLLAEYLEKARAFDRVSHRIDAALSPGLPS